MKINSFTNVAKNYTQIVSPYRFSQFLALIHELKLTGNERVLDIGTGAGIMSVEVAKSLPNGFLNGIDLSSKMTKMAKKTAEKLKMKNIDFRTASALDLPFEDGAFDVVVSSNAFPWVPQRELFLNEVRRVLKPGGRFGLVALSNDCYKEFTRTIRKISNQDPKLFPKGDPFVQMGARLHSLNQLGRIVNKAGFIINKNFKLSTVENITPEEYLKRINAIVNENYLDHLKSDRQKNRLKNLIYNYLNVKNGSLNITESSVFVIAGKSAA